MMPRNLTLFRFPATSPFDFSALDEGLPACALKPVGHLELESRGFVPPMGSACDDLAISHAGAIWLTVASQQRVLPAAVLAEALARKLAELERNEGRRPGGRLRKQIKDDLVHEMLPNAFVRTRRVDVLLDAHRGVCAVDTPSRKVAEGVVGEIRRALGSFPALPLNAELSPRGVLTGWLVRNPMPHGLYLGEECVLAEPEADGAAVRATRQDLQTEEIDRHLQAGKQVTRLALNWIDQAQFVLGEDLVLRKWHLLAGATDRMDETEQDNIEAELRARLAITVGTFREVFDTLEGALKISKAES